MEKTNDRNQRRVIQGVVTSDKMEKTIVVTVDRQVKHPKYGKFIRRSNRYHAHDANNEAKLGDLVELTETRRSSKTKSWRLVKILRRAESV